MSYGDAGDVGKMGSMPWETKRIQRGRKYECTWSRVSAWATGRAVERLNVSASRYFSHAIGPLRLQHVNHTSIIILRVLWSDKPALVELRESLHSQQRYICIHNGWAVNIAESIAVENTFTKKFVSRWIYTSMLLLARVLSDARFRRFLHRYVAMDATRNKMRLLERS